MDENQKICRRCGFVWFPKKKDVAVFCSSCRAKPVKSVKYGGEACIPHHGKFDEFDRPMVGGVLYLPGLRSCGHNDCVNVAHVVGLR